MHAAAARRDGFHGGMRAGDFARKFGIWTGETVVFMLFVSHPWRAVAASRWRGVPAGTAW
ncbi:hypothetical protein [Mobiluncus mulieris]|uniref:hypothetical protein n=1 Tax=Mobiluncus mulieris TaxID=2052 RepID=UPI00242F364F|nr:hypothetical protein [Mobiluncus mulieris]